MKNLYDEDYFERGIETNLSCYNNYRWIPELTIPLAARLIEYLNIAEEDIVLDFGCAKGYLVYALRLLHRNAFGYDISEYALTQAPKEVAPFVSNVLGEGYKWVISKDVFEHIPYKEIGSILRELSLISENLFCVVPLGIKGKYHIPAYELDKTHIIREDLGWWTQTFIQSNYTVKEASYDVKYIKDNWKKWKKGNGFFVLRSNFYD